MSYQQICGLTIILCAGTSCLPCMDGTGYLSYWGHRSDDRPMCECPVDAGEPDAGALSIAESFSPAVSVSVSGYLLAVCTSEDGGHYSGPARIPTLDGLWYRLSEQDRSYLEYGPATYLLVQCAYPDGGYDGR